MEFPFYVYSNCMKMCNMERHQLTNETKQTEFRAGFFPGLIGINCERLQSTTRRLTFASSERFLLIVLMITAGAGEHCRAGNGLPGAWPELLPGAWLACAYLGPWGPTFPCYLLQESHTEYQVQGPGHQDPCVGPGCWHPLGCQLVKLMGKPMGSVILGADLGVGNSRIWLAWL